MPKKKSKSQSNIASSFKKPLVYTLMSLEEVEEMKEKYMNRVSELRTTVIKYYTDAEEENNKYFDEKRLLDKWNAYVDCDKIPKPYKTPDMNTLIAKKNFLEGKEVESNIDWTLLIDERSILNQNICRQDLTRETLQRNSKPEFGKCYAEDVADILMLLKRIEYYLNDPHEILNVSQKIFKQIITIKPRLQSEIRNIFNRLTYRVICNEAAYMNSVDPLTAEYVFSCKSFDIQIWTLKRLPMRFAYMEEEKIIANLHNLNMTLQIPRSMLRLELTIQAVRMNFDIYSEYAKGLKLQDIQIYSKNIPNNMLDLSECLYQEWLLLREIQEKIREEMMQLRQEYDEKVQLIKEMEEKRAKEAKFNDDNKKKQKRTNTKLPPAPLQLGPNDYPDVRQDFLKEEQRRHLSFLNENYEPKNLKLSKYEINLQKYSILGGVYQFYCVQKPEHINFNRNLNNMTWHNLQRNLIIDETYRIVNRTRGSLRKSRRTTKLVIQEPSTSERGEGAQPRQSTRRKSRSIYQLNDKEEVSPWFVLTFYLPEHLCLWGDPIPCHFEMGDPDKLGVIPEVKTVVKKVEKDVDDWKNVAGPALMDYKLILMNVLNQARQAATMSQYSYHDDQIQKQSDHFILNIIDFPLDGMYDSNQTHYMEQFCVPRINSTYKFPRELREEIIKATENVKSAGGTLIAKEANNDPSALNSNKQFDCNERQNNPEYIFPVYIRPESFYIHDCLLSYKDQLPYEPKTFYQLVKVLSQIKAKYRERCQNIIDLPYFKAPINIAKRRRRIRDTQTKKVASRTPRRSVHSFRKSRLTHKKSFRLTHDSRFSMQKSKSDTISHKGSTISTPSTFVNDIDYDDYEFDEEEESETEADIAWTTRYIKNYKFDRKEFKCVIETDRLGCIGFAFNHYLHFPFKYWKLQPSENDRENEVIFTLDTQFVRCIFTVTAQGVSCCVTEPSTKYVRNPRVYLNIDKPIRDLRELKKLFREHNLNIFPNDDAGFYIEKEYFCEKHVPLEMHTYSCMAVNCNQIKFTHNLWNRVAKRRDIVLELVSYNDTEDSKVLIHLTPEAAAFVTIKELCTMDTDQIELHFQPTWRNLANYIDLQQMLGTLYPGIRESRCKNSRLICCLRDLLMEIRPLSYS